MSKRNQHIVDEKVTFIEKYFNERDPQRRENLEELINSYEQMTRERIKDWGKPGVTLEEVLGRR